MAKQMYSEKSSAAVCKVVRIGFHLDKGRLEAQSSCSDNNIAAAARNSFAESLDDSIAYQSKRELISHLLPAASPILDSIASFLLHLLANGDIRIGSIVIEHILATDRLGDGAIDTGHLLARLPATMLGSGGVGGEIAIFGQ